MKTGFPPISDEFATILIIGSMPGEDSIAKNEYYAHPRNSFWRIISKLFGFEYEASYESRKMNLVKHNIALWDVIQACERQGSLDLSIDNSTIETNDFVSFFQAHSNIQYVNFNGMKAEKEYRKRVIPVLPNETKRIEYTTLPSTSPAMARLSFSEKLLKWRIVEKQFHHT